MHHKIEAAVAAYTAYLTACKECDEELKLPPDLFGEPRRIRDYIEKNNGQSPQTYQEFYERNIERSAAIEKLKSAGLSDHEMDLLGVLRWSK